MKKTISAKRVLDELCGTYNENSVVYGYAMATGDKETADKCMECMHTVCEILKNLGFKDGVDYTSERDHKEMAEVQFMYYRKVVKA